MPEPSKNGDKPEGLTLEYVPIGRNGKAAVTAKLAGEVVAVESLDLTKAKVRASFAAAVADGRPGVNVADVEAELLRAAADLAARPTGNGKADAPGQPDPAALLAAMPQDVRTTAHAMLEDSHLLKRIVDDIEALGVAGEKELATALYLVGTSRLLPQPLAAIVQGPSSSGKTYVIEKVGGMFPPEAVVWATQMTPQALFHLKPGSLRHRFIVAGERSRLENDETAEATRALREMLSSGRLVKLMPMKVGVGGEMQTVSIEQDGPIAYVESTTLGTIFAEDANRCLLLTTDEQQEQTRRIIARLAAGYSGGAGDGRAEEIKLRHHALQRILQPLRVAVPYAERLGELVADERVEARRAFPQLVSMVQASALLHQRQRKVNGDGWLVADADDYQLARRLLARPMERLLGGRVSEPARRFLDRLREWFGPQENFAKSDAAKRETGSRSSVYGWLSELADSGLVELVEEGRGSRPAKWKLGDLPGDGDRGAGVLPTLQQVFGDGPWTPGHKP